MIVLIGGAAFTCAGTSGQLPSSLFVRVAQSTDAAPGNGPLNAVDGSTATFSLTADVPGSFWTAELGRFMMAGCAMWMAIGVFVMKQMINFDF